MCRRILVAVPAVIAILSAAPSPATASPWVLDEDEIVVTGRFDFQQADSEFFEPGEAEPFSLNGRYRSAAFDLGMRLGLVDKLEFGVNVPVKLVTYKADPVILLPGGDEAGIDYYQENVIDTSQTRSGVADIRMTTRYQFLEGALAGAFEFQLETPTGYEKPSGTFGDEPKSREDFLANIGTYVRPENIEDDVTLGDGQVDVTASALFGWAFPTKTYLRLDTGYALRLGGAGDQIRTQFQVGQALGNRVLLKFGSKFDYSVQEGEVIGVSVAAEDPTLPASEYAGTKNLRLREVPLSYDRLQLHGGALVRVSRQVELSLSYGRTVWGRNIAISNVVSFGVASKFDLAAEETS